MTARDGWFYLYPWVRESGERASANARRHCDRAQTRREHPEETTKAELAEFADGGVASDD
jgi:hypothetical protein